MSSSPDYLLALEYAYERLQKELSSVLTYHSYWHSRHEVMQAVAYLARQYDLSEQDRRLLEVGAAFHDIGFVISSVEHEVRGVRIARSVLPKFGFGQEQVQQIAGLIMATRLPQSPKNLLEQILADADLDVLGRSDFFKRSEDLRLELAGLGNPIPPLQWYEIQRDFLRHHIYFTAEARLLRQPSKDRHIQILTEVLRDERGGVGEPVRG